ncbi:MAG: hypothetical protein WD342_00095 [Verrucomicrobiales bacterium]
MSGIVGHAGYAILAAKAAAARKLPVAPLIHRHFSSYLAGSYLGCDVQTLPAALCVDTGEPVGYGSSPIEKSPLTGGEVSPWRLRFEGRDYTPREVHDLFYGRSHLILGWKGDARDLAIGWAQYLDYAADAAGDAIELFGPGERPLAYLLGWMTHVTGDGLVKSVLDGLNLNLLDGKYTAKNRPIQDLVVFNEIGRRELGLNWAALLDDLAATPVEPLQGHYMRCGERQGRLGAHFDEGWEPGLAPLLQSVLAENRSFQKVRNRHLVGQLTVKPGPGGVLRCDEELSRTTGGLSYVEMVELAEKADFRHAMWQMGELVADLFEKVIDRQEVLQELAASPEPDWEELTARWRRRG